MQALAIWAWLAAHHCGVPCAAAILGNAQVEVGRDLNPCTSTSQFAGLFQWAGERKQRLFKRYGRSWCKLENQLEYLLYELQQMGMLQPMLKARGLSQAAAIMDRFEGGAGGDVRVAFSKRFYATMQTYKGVAPSLAKAKPKRRPAIEWTMENI